MTAGQEDLDEMTRWVRSLGPPKWYAPYWPFHHIPNIRLLSVTFYKGSTCTHPVTKRHLLDTIKTHSGRLVGFQIWY